MKSLRPWIQVGLLSAIALWNASGSAYTEDAPQPVPEVSRPAAVTPDVTAEDSSDEEAQPATEEPAGEAIAPEPETSLPTTSATPPTGE